jgi:hypothetical protein
LKRGKLGARHQASMGKIMGTLCISGVIDIRKCKSDVHTRCLARASQSSDESRSGETRSRFAIG